jgi:hypothetical protein
MRTVPVQTAKRLARGAGEPHGHLLSLAPGAGEAARPAGASAAWIVAESRSLMWGLGRVRFRLDAPGHVAGGC